MIVLDASVAVDWLVQTAAAQRIESRIFSRNQSLHAPELLDLEVAQVLRSALAVANEARMYLAIRLTFCRYAIAPASRSPA